MKSFVLLVTALVIATTNANTELDEFIAGNIKFTARLYTEILKAFPNENFVFSPFSIEVILALTRAGARGNTADEFGVALNLPSKKVTIDVFNELLPKFTQSSDDLKLLSANKLYLAIDFTFLKCFEKLAREVFDAGTERVNFSRPIEAADIINQWVENQTNNKIQDLIPADALSSSTRLVLVNALYFNGKWVLPFSDHTNKEIFYLSNGNTKEVDMMNNDKGTFRYLESEELNAQIIELPYKGDNISMTIVLPKKCDGLSSIENNLEAALTPQALEYYPIDLKVPQFLIESELELTGILQELGLIQVFTDAADLSGLSHESLKVDAVVQKAFINVTTTGTEAAAATGVIIVPTAVLPPPSIKFTANHPFLYYIKYEGVILFAGRVAF